jgi:hypothetical protein
MDWNGSEAAASLEGLRLRSRWQTTPAKGPPSTCILLESSSLTNSEGPVDSRGVTWIGAQPSASIGQAVFSARAVLQSMHDVLGSIRKERRGQKVGLWGGQGARQMPALEPVLQRTGGPQWWEATLFCGRKEEACIGGALQCRQVMGKDGAWKKGGCRSMVTGPRHQRQGMGGRIMQGRAGWLAGLNRVGAE